MSQLSTLQENPGSDSPGFINRNAYSSITLNLCKQSLLTVFKLSYIGKSQNVKKFVKKKINEKKFRMHQDQCHDLITYSIDDFDVTMLKTLLESPEICDLGTFVEVEGNECGENMMGKKLTLDYSYGDYSYWGDETLQGKKLEIPSLEFWIREIVNIRNDCSHNQKEDMTEKKLNEKLKILKDTMKEMILRMRIRYPDMCYENEIEQLEKCLRDLKEKPLTVPIWKDITASLEDELMMRVFECIGDDKEIDIRLPALENEKDIHLDVPASKVYLKIQGEGSDKEQISSTNVVKLLRDSKRFPNRCLVLVGLPGVGKTTSLFRIKEEHISAINNKKMDLSFTPTKINYLEFELIEDIEVLIYHALRSNKHKSLSELIHYKFGPATKLIIPHSRQLQSILLNRPSILLLDAIDESSEVSSELVKDIWKNMDNFPNLHIIFTTRGTKGNVLKECAGKDYDNMCINVSGLDPSEFLENSGKLIDVILENRKGRERNPANKKQQALSNLQKIKLKFPPVATNPLLLTIAVRLVLDPYMRIGDHLDNLNSMTQLIKGMMESLKRRLCDNKEINEDIVDEYLDFLGNESIGMLQRNSFTINPDLTNVLREKIKMLGINEKDSIERVLQSFLSKKEESIFQHLHAVTQSYLAAKALLKKFMELLEISKPDLNLEINNHMKGIPKEHQQTVLMLMVGILHDHEENACIKKKKDTILNEIALNVCSYFDFPQYNYFDDQSATILHLFQESFAGGSGKPNEIFEKEILNKAPDSIYIHEEALEVIKYTMTKQVKRNWPKEITITVQSNPDNILNLIPVLDLLNERNSCIYLEVLQCSESLLRNLPDNLERLMIHFTKGEAFNMVGALNTRLQSLHKLNMCIIYLNEGGSLPQEGLPQLHYTGNLLIMDMRLKFKDSTVSGAASIMAWACKGRQHLSNGLTLNDSPLSVSGCSKLLDELSILNVQAMWLCIHQAELAAGDREMLQKKGQSIGIRLFTPPGKYIFIRGQHLIHAIGYLERHPQFTMDMLEYVLEALTGNDRHLTATFDTLIKEFTRSNKTIVASDQIQSADDSNTNTSSNDDQIGPIVVMIQQILSTDPIQFGESLKGALEFMAQIRVQNKDYDFIGPLSGIMLSMLNTDRIRFHELLKGALKVMSNRDVKSSYLAGHIKNLMHFLIGAGKSCMKENPNFVKKMMSAIPPQMMLVLLPQIMGLLSSSGTSGASAPQHVAPLPQSTPDTEDTRPLEEKMSEVKLEEDFDLD